jgi:RecG-like helicase
MCFEQNNRSGVQRLLVYKSMLTMKKVSLLFATISGLVLLALATPTFAAGKTKQVTITGEAKCAKCMLKQSDKCQTVVQAEGKNGKMVTYYLTDTDAAKAFHENVCHEAKKVTVSGAVKKVDGKRELAATEIKLVN